MRTTKATVVVLEPGDELVIRESGMHPMSFAISCSTKRLEITTDHALQVDWGEYRRATGPDYADVLMPDADETIVALTLVPRNNPAVSKVEVSTPTN